MGAITIFFDAKGNVCGSCPAGQEQEWLKHGKEENNSARSYSTRASTDAK